MNREHLDKPIFDHSTTAKLVLDETTVETLSARPVCVLNDVGPRSGITWRTGPPGTTKARTTIYM